ncbi:MAG: hypothetical protein NTW29_02350 [Bacteroidetes bacterium]|nr:hypothetical protein [Bacteroidota bacterium]
MAKYLTLLLLSTALISCSHTTAQQWPDKLNTTRSAQYVNIPGTRAFLLKPAGFSLSSSMPAIEKGNSSMVQVMDLVGGNFYTNAATFTKKRFEEKGLKVIEYKEFTLNNFPAKMACIEKDAQTNMINMVFGDTSFSASVIGMYPAADKELKKQVTEAMQSLYYDKAFTIDPFAAAPFHLNQSASVFKFAKLAASIYMYSINGVDKKAYENEPYLMVISGPAEGTSMASMAADMADVVTGGTAGSVVETPVNGLPSYKRVVRGTINGKPGILYQHLVMIGETIVIMQGVIPDKNETYIAEFEKLTMTVRKK